MRYPLGDSLNYGSLKKLKKPIEPAKKVKFQLSQKSSRYQTPSKPDSNQKLREQEMAKPREKIETTGDYDDGELCANFRSLRPAARANDNSIEHLNLKLEVRPLGSKINPAKETHYGSSFGAGGEEEAKRAKNSAVSEEPSGARTQEVLESKHVASHSSKATESYDMTEFTYIRNTTNSKDESQDWVSREVAPQRPLNLEPSHEHPQSSHQESLGVAASP